MFVSPVPGSLRSLEHFCSVIYGQYIGLPVRFSVPVTRLPPQGHVTVSVKQSQRLQALDLPLGHNLFPLYPILHLLCTFLCPCAAFALGQFGAAGCGISYLFHLLAQNLRRPLSQCPPNAHSGVLLLSQ